ncbi:MAG: hypothetical protein ACKODH_08465 [Limisphaerales bacterium]
MLATRTYTNHYQDFQLLELSKLLHTEGRGPFMVVQEGAAPDDSAMRHCSFVLTRRGTWLHYYLFLALPEEVRRRIAMFDTVPEVFARAETLPAHVRVEDAVSLQELLRDEGFEPGAEDEQGRALYKDLRRRHPDELRPKLESTL